MKLRAQTTEKNAVILTHVEEIALRMQLTDVLDSREVRLLYPGEDSPLHDLMRVLVRPGPVDPELFARTAPQWNCVNSPGGPHYLSAGPDPARGTCLWCGTSP